MDMDVDRKHANEVQSAMENVLSELHHLEDELSAQGADTTTDQRESSICMAIYNLGNVASPGTKKMGSFLPSTAQFVEACKLGEGLHGVVVKARDSVTGETVALKTLHPKPLNYADSEEEEEEDGFFHPVLREACFMAACRGHPSLVGLSAIGRHPHTGEYCLVMEHVGPSLDYVLKDQRGGKPFPERDVRRIMRQVLSGAEVMHDRGVVHRAINPTNILVGDGGNVVKIGDFGEATSMSEEGVLNDSNLMSYIAPEFLIQMPNIRSREEMDTWSMGCLMLELLTGEDQFYVEVDDDVEVDGDVERQVQKIHDVLGLWDKRIMEAMKPAVDVELPLKVQQYRVQIRGGRLRELVPREVLSDRGFAVLRGLLTYSPKARLTAAAALQFPWFADDNIDDSPAISVSRVFIGALALLFLMVFVCLRYWW